MSDFSDSVKTWTFTFTFCCFLSSFNSPFCCLMQMSEKQRNREMCVSDPVEVMTFGWLGKILLLLVVFSHFGFLSAGQINIPSEKQNLRFFLLLTFLMFVSGNQSLVQTQFPKPL